MHRRVSGFSEGQQLTNDASYTAEELAEIMKHYAQGRKFGSLNMVVNKGGGVSFLGSTYIDKKSGVAVQLGDVFIGKRGVEQILASASLESNARITVTNAAPQPRL